MPKVPGTTMSLFFCIVTPMALSTISSVAATAVNLQSRFDQISPNTIGCESADDAMRLIVVDRGKQLGKRDFCSSYGKASAKVVADKRGRNYMILNYTEGRGTNVSIEYLSIFRLPLNDKPEIARIPISRPTRPLQRFMYKYDILANREGVLEVSLRGNADHGGRCCISAERTIRIVTAE